MSSVDWRGVAMALGQLKDIAGPTELQKMQFKSDLVEGRAEDAREFAAREKEKDRLYKAATDKFEYLQGRHEKLQTKIAAKRKSMFDISASWDMLNDEDKSPGKGFEYVTADNETTPLRQAQQNTDNIESAISSGIIELTRITDIHTGMQFGKELRISEGAVGFQQVQGLYDDGKITEEQYNNAKNYDRNKIEGVDHAELQMGLLNQLALMKEAGLPTAGVEAGYWSAYKGKSAEDVEGFTYERELYATISAAQEKGAKAKIIGTAEVLSQDHALKLLDEYMNMTQSVYNDPAWYEQLPKDEKDSYHEEIGKLAETLSGSQYGHLLDPIWIGDALDVKKRDQADYTDKYFPGYNRKGTPKAYEGQGLTYDTYMDISKGNLEWEGLDKTTNRMKNHLVRTELDFMMRNWNKGGPKNKGLYKDYIPIDKRDNTYNPTGEQRRFDRAYDNVIKLKEAERI